MKDFNDNENDYTKVWIQSHEAYSIQNQIKDVFPVIWKAIGSGYITANDALMIIEDLANI